MESEPMSRFLEKLSEKKVLVSDGAWGTMLQQAGLQTGACPEIWNLTHPDLVQAVAAAYVSAGSDIVETNSFGGTSIKLKHYGLEAKAFDLNYEAVQLSRNAAGSDVLVMASMGPTGKFLFMDEVTEDDLYDAFREQATAFDEAGADAVIIETFYDVQEALLAIRAVKENTLLPCVCSFTYQLSPEGAYTTMMGSSPASVTASLLDAGADVIGTNCGNGFEGMLNLVSEIEACSMGKPILMQANAGLPIVTDGKMVYTETPEYAANLTTQFLSRGVSIIGGCCGTTPDHIAAIRRVTDAWLSHK